MLTGNKNWTLLKCFFYISDEYAHWILVNVELSNSKVIKSWKTVSNEKTVTNMKIISVKCKKNEDNNNIKVKSNLKRCYWQIWNFQVSNFETDYQCNPEKYFCQTGSEKDNELKIYRESYTSGNFIWNLWNEPSTTSVRFCLSYVCFKWDFIALKVEIISTENLMLSRTAS